MHIHRLALLVSSVLGLLYSQQGSAPAPGFEAPDLGYKLLPDWPNPPRNAAGSFGVWNLIQVASVAVDSRRRVLVLHRGAHPALEFDAAGKFLRSWGNGLISEGKVGAVARDSRAPGASGYSAVYGPAGCDSCGAHSIRVDPQGNTWLVDAPSHVIYKLKSTRRSNPAARPEGRLGYGIEQLQPADGPRFRAWRRALCKRWIWESAGREVHA